MNIITIDPSINSTAVVINGDAHIFSSSHITWNDKGTTLRKWFKLCEPHLTIHTINYEWPKTYSDKEVYMLEEFVDIATRICDTIKDSIWLDEPSVISIEGYSYSSNAGPLIDLVTFSTIIRQELHALILNYGNDKKLIIVPPTSLKLETAKLVYEPVNVGKRVEKFEWRNNDGIMGGSFKKHQMSQALIDYKDSNLDWVEFLRDNADVILAPKHIPKPIEDINDAMLQYLILRNKEKNELSLDFEK